jgi:peptidoglycan/xylan/chitin deacetylase (PgdA/CDA1 family)
LPAWFGRWALRLSDREVGVILVYHGVASRSGDCRRELSPAIGLELLKAQLRHHRRCYRVVDLDAMLSAVKSRRRGERIPIALTFDDDLRSHVELAAPALRDQRLPATFFICGDEDAVTRAYWWEPVQAALDNGRELPAPLANRLDPDAIAAAMLDLTGEQRDALTKELWDDLRHEPPRHLDASDIAAIVGHGATIGFHTCGHRVLTHCDDRELKQQLCDGIARLRHLSGQEVAAVAYPHGYADERIASHARAAFRIGATAEPTAVTAGSDPLLLGRIEPSFLSLSDHAWSIVRVLLQTSRRQRRPTRSPRASPRRPS